MDEYGYDNGYDGTGGDAYGYGDFDPGAASLISDGGGDIGYDGGFDPGASSMISNGDITDNL